MAAASLGAAEALAVGHFMGIYMNMVNNRTAAENAFVYFMNIFRLFTVRFWLSRYPVNKRVKTTEIYHLAVLIVLYIFTKYINSIPLIVIIIILIYLVNEQVIWSLFDVLIEAHNKSLQGRRNPIRSVMWVLYSGIILIWIFGLYYYASRDVGTYIGHLFIPLSNLPDAIYYSISNIMSLGTVSYFIKANAGLTRLFVVFQPLIGLGILLFYLATLVSSLSFTFRESIDNDKLNIVREKPAIINRNYDPKNNIVILFLTAAIVFITYIIFRRKK